MPSDPGKVYPHGGQRAANVVVDLPGDGGALLFDGGLQVLGELRQALLRGRQLGHGEFAVLAGLVHLDGPRDHVRKAGDIVLEQVIGEAQAHGVHRRRLANGPRQQHKWHRCC